MKARSTILDIEVRLTAKRNHIVVLIPLAVAQRIGQAQVEAIATAIRKLTT